MARPKAQTQARMQVWLRLTAEEQEQLRVMSRESTRKPAEMVTHIVRHLLLHPDSNIARALRGDLMQILGIDE